MGLLKFTKSFTAADDGSTITGAEMGQLQSDIAAILNAGISNANIASAAAIAESKLAFSTSTGHTHNGTDAAYPLIKHYRRDMQVQYASATTVTVLPGVLDVGGNLFITTTSTTLDITTDFLGGQAEPANGTVYIYAYDNSGTIGFKMSTSFPELSDSDGNTDEFPLRYHDDATLDKCRLIGTIYNRGDILPDMCINFDLSNFATGSWTSDTAVDSGDITVVTGWTPNFIQWVLCSDSIPANGETLDKWGNVQRYGFITANPQPKDLMYSIIDNQHLTSSATTANTISAITAQSTAAAGSFKLEAITNGQVLMWCAWSHGQGSV
jgi:hypothetical protein